MITYDELFTGTNILYGICKLHFFGRLTGAFLAWQLVSNMGEPIEPNNEYGHGHIYS